MPSSRVWGNQDPTIFASYVNNDVSLEFGIACEAYSDAAIDEVGFYRLDTGVDNHADALRVYDKETGDLLWETTTPDDNGEIGWQRTLLTEPLAVLQHQRLWVTAHWQPSVPIPLYQSIVAYPVIWTMHLPDLPALVGVPFCGYHYPSGAGVVNILDDNYNPGVDARFVTATPGGSGTLLAETDFTTAIKWVQEADYYLVTITSSPQASYERDADGVVISRLIGSWSPLEGDYAGQRFQMDFKQMKLVLPAGQHMTGVSVALLQGAEAHIEAWSL
jgi:hypothetical protein